MYTIEIEGLNKVFMNGKIELHAINELDLKISSGEFTAIVGPSGSGKTTLLNLIGGLESPSSGKIMIDGQDIGNFSRGKLFDFRLNNIGFVFQAYNLVPVLSALENVEFILQLQGVSAKKREVEAVKVLESVGLGDRLNSRPAELSGGQQQRVAVGRALVSKPKFILADEPTANLDSKTSEHLLDLMAELNESKGITFLFSTHDPRVMKRARRIITVEDGKIISDEKN